MIAAELRGGNKPGLNEALGWIGSRVDDIYGANVGRLDDVWIDPGSGMPRWLLVKEGRFGGRTTLIPFEDATAGAGHVWIPYERDVVRHAPEVEPGAPLTQSVESALREHYRGHGGSHGERRSQTAAPRPTYRQVPAAHPQPPPHVHAPPSHAPAHAHHAQPSHSQPAQDALALHGALPQRSHAHTAAGTPISGLRPNPNQPPPQPPVEAGPPEALGIPVPPPYQAPDPEAGSAFGQARVQPAHAAPPQPAPRVQQQRFAPPPQAPQHGYAANQPSSSVPSAQAPAPRPQAADAGWPPATAAPQHQPSPYPPAPQAPMSQMRQPAPPPYAPPAAQEPAPAPRQPAPEEHDPPVAIPVIHALDRPQRIEIQLAGELTISGELRGFSLKPVEPDPGAGETR